MERLNEDEITLIAQKLAAHGTPSLLSFMKTPNIIRRSLL